MAFITRIFFQGLIVILPIVLTVWVIWWVASTAEAALRPMLEGRLPDDRYIPGMGLAVGVALIFVVGLLVNTWGTRQLIGLGVRALNRVPLIRAVYGPMRDLMQFFSSSEKPMGQVAMVRLGETDLHLLGFVTRQEFADMPAELGGADRVAVYLPMSFQIGGFTVMAPKAAIQPVPMSVEEAMKFALTAGLTTKE